MLQPNFITHSIMKFTTLWSGKWSRVEAILLYFHFYSILKEKMEFYIEDAFTSHMQRSYVYSYNNWLDLLLIIKY